MRYASITRRLEGLGTDKWAVHYAAQARIEAGEPVVMLSIGEPDFPPPRAVAAAAIRGIEAGRVKYSTGRGEANVLAAIAARYARRTGRAISTDQVIFMPGTQCALLATMMALAESGDEVIVPEPFYVTYDGIVAATGARQVAVATQPETGFHLTAADLRRAITPRTRVLLLNSPSNPSGAVLSADEVAEIGAVCAEHDLWIVSDEVYDSLVFADVAFASPFDDPVLAERTVVVSSLSKSHSMTGYRAGWAVGPADFCTRMLPFAEVMLFGCQPFIQDAAAFALSNEFDECAHMKAALEARGRRTVEMLQQSQFVRAAMPEGGMFVFADVRPTGLTGEAFALGLLSEENIAVMPGESFGKAGAGHVRISLTAPLDVLEPAVAAIVSFCARRSRQA
jgi:arginine:pyruvate transaminase